MIFIVHIVAELSYSLLKVCQKGLEYTDYILVVGYNSPPPKKKVCPLNCI